MSRNAIGSVEMFVLTQNAGKGNGGGEWWGEGEGGNGSLGTSHFASMKHYNAVSNQALLQVLPT